MTETRGGMGYTMVARRGRLTSAIFRLSIASFIHTYPAGTWGPEEVARLFDSEDHMWRNGN